MIKTLILIIIWPKTLINDPLSSYGNWKSFNFYIYKCNYLNEHQGNHLIFYFSQGTPIQGGRSFEPGFSIKKCNVGTSEHITLTVLANKFDLLNLEIITKCVCEFPYYKKQRISDWRKLLLCHSYKLSEWTPLETLQIFKWVPLSWFVGALI